MRFLLDTNACIRVLNGSSPGVVDQLEKLDPADVTISAIVKAELTYGARKSRRVAANLRLIDAFVEPFACLPFDNRAADVYGSIRADLEHEGRSIGPNDLLIAATALAHSLTLVTHNVSEFNRVPGLSVADWESED